MSECKKCGNINIKYIDKCDRCGKHVCNECLEEYEDLTFCSDCAEKLHGDNDIEDDC